jgi:hypothetical protein
VGRVGEQMRSLGLCGWGWLEIPFGRFKVNVKDINIT